MQRNLLVSLSLLVSAGVVALACGDSAGSSAFDGTSSSGSSGASGASGSSGTSGSPHDNGLFSGSTEAGASSSSSGGDGTPELCDGIDNDGNGIVDDLDVGNDGVCDCLRIATLGTKGPWGEGDVFAKWLNGKSTAGVIDLAAQTLTPALLGQYQVIVAQDLSKIKRTYAADEVAALGDWVKGGGGFLTLIGYGNSDERTNANLLLGTFGLGYAAAGILPQANGSTIPVTHWTAHPITDGITKIGVDNGYEVTGAGGTVLGTEKNLTVLKAVEASSGHVIAWGDEWITYNSEWKDHPDYQVERFWLNMIKWLTPAKECQVPIPATVK